MSDHQPGETAVGHGWWRSVMAGALALALGLGLLAALWLLARPLGFLILGITIAASLAPPVGWLARRMPRSIAVILIYLILLVILVGIGWLVSPPLIAEAQSFGDHVPQTVEQMQQWVRSLNIPAVPDGVSPTSTLTSALDSVGSRLVSLPLSFASSLLDIFLVIFISLYALIIAPGLRRFISSLWPAKQAERVDDVLAEMATAMGGYARGVVISGAIIGVLTYVGLLIIGVEFPIVLGVLSGLLVIVPVIGPILSGLVIVGVALSHSTNQALIAFVFALALQQVESNLIFPNVMRNQTNTSPVLTIFALFAGNAVGGALGALVAIPVAAAARVFVVRVVAPMIRSYTGAPPYTPENDDEKDS